MDITRKSISQNPIRIVKLLFTEWVLQKPTFSFKEKIHGSVSNNCEFLHGQTVEWDILLILKIKFNDTWEDMIKDKLSSKINMYFCTWCKTATSENIQRLLKILSARSNCTRSELLKVIYTL